MIPCKQRALFICQVPAGKNKRAYNPKMVQDSSKCLGESGCYTIKFLSSLVSLKLPQPKNRACVILHASSQFCNYLLFTSVIQNNEDLVAPSKQEEPLEGDHGDPGMDTDDCRYEVSLYR